MNGQRLAFDTNLNLSDDLPESLIREFFPPKILKALMILCLRVDIADNNDKADIVKELLNTIDGSEGFEELGVGTNRAAFLYRGLAIKIALDRRGLIDNFAEAKRSAELPMYLAKTYESNLLINIAEYVNIIDQSTFMENEQPIRAVLEDISKGYLFNDVGFIKKNYCNWGCRTTSAGDSLVILDYGYMYPLIGQNLEELFKCPVCGGRLKWNGTYSKLVCSGNKKNAGFGGRCMCTVEPNEIRRRMNRRLDSYENKLIASLSGSSMPDLDTIEQALHEEVDI